MRSLVTIQAKICEHLAEYQRVRHARASESDAKARARAELATRRADAEAELASSVGRWTDSAAAIAGMSELFPRRDALELSLIVNFERVEARILEAITNDYRQEPGGLPAEQRAARLDELARELRDLAVEEEAAIRRHESNGQEVPRRADAPCAVVLARDLAAVTVAAVRDEIDAP